MAIFPSTLVISANPNLQTFIQELATDFPDILTINSDYSIAAIRQIRSFLAQKPYSHQNKLVIIQNADQLSPESQNTLLKTLEEPGNNNYLILTTAKPSALLPTIHSRCHILRQKNPQRPPALSLKISPDLKTNLLESEKLSQDKDSVLPLLREQLAAYHQTLPQNPQNAQIIKKLILAIQMIESNVDPKSALDYFFLA